MGGNRPGDSGDEGRIVKRFFAEIEGAGLDGLDRQRHIAMPGQEDDRRDDHLDQSQEDLGEDLQVVCDVLAGGLLHARVHRVADSDTDRHGEEDPEREAVVLGEHGSNVKWHRLPAGA